MKTYDVGERVTLSMTWRHLDTGALFDPHTVRVMLYRQYGDSVEYVHGVDPELVRIAEGQYEAEYTPMQWGHWRYRWEALNNVGIMQDAEERPFFVRRSWFRGG